MESLTKAVKTLRLKVDGTNWTGAAGTSDLNSDVVDMKGFRGCRFLVGFGAIVSGAVTSIKVQQDTKSDFSGDPQDLKNTKVTVADDDDNQVAIVEVLDPLERYLRVVTDRGTQNATVDFVIAELFGARDKPITDDAATTIGNEVHGSPIEGTA